MSAPIHLLYSADYELFLGANHLPEEEVLLRPTARLLETCAELAIPLTLFADVLSLRRYRELGREAFPAAAEVQLRAAVAQGHDVQLHLHPHWLQARPEGRAWAFPPQAFTLGGLGGEPAAVTRLTSGLAGDGRAYLEALLQPVRPAYRCVAFRAGGYALQPEVGAVLAGLRAAGVRIDSSMVPGQRFGAGAQALDYRRWSVPPGGDDPWRDGPNPWLSERYGLAQPAPTGEGVWEIPIAAVTLSRGAACAWGWYTLLRHPGLLLGGEANVRRGQPYVAADTSPVASPARFKQAYWRLRGLLGRRQLRLELGRDVGPLLACLERYLRYQRPAGGPVFLSLCSHPKGLGESHWRALRTFQRQAVARFGADWQPLTFQQAAQRQGLCP